MLKFRFSGQQMVQEHLTFKSKKVGSNLAKHGFSKGSWFSNRTLVTKFLTLKFLYFSLIDKEHVTLGTFWNFRPVAVKESNGKTNQLQKLKIT